ncbi:MAG: HAMP domain-containing sensor histidine kinase [Patescibacteria group bacterium]
MNDLIGIDSNEKEVARTRTHWIVFVESAGLIILLALGPFLIHSIFTGNFVIPKNGGFIILVQVMGYLWILIAWIALLTTWTSYRLNRLIVTDRRIVHVVQMALFASAVRTWRMDAIKEVFVNKRGPLQVTLNYGSIMIRTSNNATTDTIFDVPNPERFREAIFRGVSSIATLTAENVGQTQLLHTISHEVKAHLAKNAAALASIVEGDFGQAPEQLKKMAGEALAETRKGVSMVTDILKTSDFKTGSITFEKHAFDLKKAIENVIAELKPESERKKLVLDFTATDSACFIIGDEEKIRDHVIKNLIENAIRYTPAGSIHVALAHIDKFAVLMVADTGVGISGHDLSKLFTEGGKGDQSTAVNPSSTGYGLFIAKSVVDAHGGSIWAQSPGSGSGSQFYACLPAV